ncbi:MAG TPA: GNAT family N-acetyltransferase [Ktedonobacterales bacterium]|nr:GNAT family N-acetyltransferase [Ktedonobacterales bacterium]
MTPDRFPIRQATVADTHVIADHRVLMFIDTGRLTPDAAATMRKSLPPILQPMLATGEYVGWLVTGKDSEIIAGAGVQVRRLLPRPETFLSREALVVNVYVEPDYRRRGLARRLMQTILDWCRQQRIERVSLHASIMGRPLYESMGFTQTNELVYYVRDADATRTGDNSESLSS